MANRDRKLVLPLILLAIGGALFLWWRSAQTAAEPEDAGGAASAAALLPGGSGGTADRATRSVPALALLADPGGTIAGTITAPDGKPVAGADVCARSRDDDLGSAQKRQPRCVLSEHDGSYRIDGLWRVKWGVGAAKRGYIPTSYGRDDDDFEGLRLDREPEQTGIDLVLEPGGVEVTGVVKDLGGGEIEGAFVAGTSGQWGWRSGASWGAVARTDAEGKFSLWVEEGDVQLTAQADGYTSAWEQGIAPGIHFTLILTPESVLAGVVRDSAGNPVPGARVSASSGEFFSQNGGSAIADADGRYRIDQLGPGRYKPSAKADGFEGMAKESVRLGIGESQDPVDVFVHPAAMVDARVVIEGGGDCPTGSVSLHDPKTQVRVYGSTKDGSVRIPAVRPGHYQVSVECRGYAAAAEYTDLDVGQDDVTGLVYTVTEGRSIRGVLVDADGHGVDEGTVFAQLKSAGRGTSRQAFDQPDDSGHFELEGLAPGTYTLNAWCEGHPQPKDPIEVEIPESGDADEVRIVFEASGRIRGTVKDAEGGLVSGIDVRAKGPQGGSSKVLDDGTFELEGLREGDYRVSAQGAWWGDSLRKPGTGDDDVQGTPVTVSAGEVAEVDLVVEVRKGKIEGTVVDEAGGPLADAYISVTRESDSAVAAQGRARQRSRWGWGRDPILSDVDGRFVAEDLADGAYTLRAYRNGGGEGFVEGVEVGSTTEIRIEVEASLAGKVVLAAGGTPDHFNVHVSDKKAGFDRNEAFTRTDGAWAMHELPAGTYDVVVSAAEGTADLKDVELAAAQERDGLALTLEGRTTIRGRVVALDTGEPVAGLVVNASRAGAGMSFSFGEKHGKEVTAADGTYELENAPSGKVTLYTFPTNFMDWDATGRGSLVFEAPAGGVAEAPDILLPPQRVKRGEQSGDLGFKLQEAEPGSEPGDQPKVVGFIRPGSPAAATELKVGDVIVSVDGHDITGANTGLYRGLTDVKEGTSIELGLQRDAKVRITAGPPV